MRAVLAAVEQLLLPARCPGCGAVAAVLCRDCAFGLDVCGLADHGAVRLADGVVAVGAFAYEGTAAAIVRGLKLGDCWAAAGGLGDLLRERLALPPATEVPTTWVPSSPARLRERGFELPRLLAGTGAVGLLATTRERPDQTDLGMAARLRNPQGAFVARGPVPRGVVLVDDVRTTGATATAAALALRAAGARRVAVVTFAVAGGR